VVLPVVNDSFRTGLRASGERALQREQHALPQLTAQELQVARFVAQCLSDRDVAAQLFASPRTIDFHLRDVFTKIGVSSRAQLSPCTTMWPAGCSDTAWPN
jgi:DNA-binding NarL/FixJ family response regulator